MKAATSRSKPKASGLAKAKTKAPAIARARGLAIATRATSKARPAASRGTLAKVGSAPAGGKYVRGALSRAKVTRTQTRVAPKSGGNPAQDIFNTVGGAVNGLVEGIRRSVNLGEGTVSRRMNGR